MAQIVEIQKLEQLVGQSLEPGPWLKVEQSDINQFADLTRDHQYIHVDTEAAKQTPFGGTIAHGFLSLSLLTYLTEPIILAPPNITMAMNYGFDKVRFLNPVRTGSEIRAVATLAAVTDKGDNRLLLTHNINVEIKGEEKPALVCEWLSLFFTAP